MRDDRGTGSHKTPSASRPSPSAGIELVHLQGNCAHEAAALNGHVHWIVDPLDPLNDCHRVLANPALWPHLGLIMYKRLLPSSGRKCSFCSTLEDLQPPHLSFCSFLIPVTLLRYHNTTNVTVSEPSERYARTICFRQKIASASCRRTPIFLYISASPLKG